MQHQWQLEISKSVASESATLVIGVYPVSAIRISRHDAMIAAGAAGLSRGWHPRAHAERTAGRTGVVRCQHGDHLTILVEVAVIRPTETLAPIDSLCRERAPELLRNNFNFVTG